MANKETFCIACIQGLRKLYRCNNPLSIKLLVFILEFADFDTGYSSVSRGGLIDASHQFNVSEDEILESLDELIENEIIFRAIGRELTTGKPALFDYIFILNPHVIWFGKYANKEPKALEFLEIYYYSIEPTPAESRLEHVIEEGLDIISPMTFEKHIQNRNDYRFQFFPG